MSDDKSQAFASAELGDVIRGDLSLDKANDGLFRDFAGAVPQEDVAFLNYLDGLLQEDDRIDGGLRETKLGQLLLQNRGTATATQAASDGNVSQMKALVGLTSTTGDGRNALAEAADRLADEGAIGLCFGPPGAGKTATVLDVAVVWRAVTGGRIVTNITGWPAADHHATSSEDVLDYMASVKEPVLAVLDEVREELKADNRKKAEAFAEALRFIRKKEDGDRYAKKGSALLVAHTQNGTAPGIRRLSTFALRKPSRKDPGRVELLESVGGVDEWHVAGEFRGLTDTSETFSEHEASDFRVVLDDDRDDGTDQIDPDDVRREEAIATVLRACKPWDEDDGMNYREAAALVDYGKSWVGDRVREWSDGEHRDILDEPE